MNRETGPPTSLHVDRWTDMLSGHVERHPGFWIGLGGWETRILKEKLTRCSIDRPIYVSGLARSGSTILLELLARHPDAVTHRYRDFPPVLTPWFWNWFLDRAATKAHVPTERAHRDRIKVTPESPEAFEEVIWAAFFPDIHAPETSSVLDENTRNAAFEAFYRDHVRKLMLLRGGSRYIAKGNYNITRFGYLRSLFPDARFVVPIRDPVWHIASLMKQHDLFSREEAANGRILGHMRRTGHFEFGLDRRPIHTGDAVAANRIRELWQSGREVEGWARYWALIYGHLDETLARDAELRAATLIVRYEDFCDDPAGLMATILEHCAMPTYHLPETARAVVRPPDYYSPVFTDDERALIRQHSDGVARRYGYGEPASSRQAASNREAARRDPASL